jgi:hypothetical protein
MAEPHSLPIWLFGRGFFQFLDGFYCIMRNRVVSGKMERANLAHFRFLGLRRGESDALTIRSAARAMSGLIGEGEGRFGVEGEVRRRSEIALATYRLLDPRRRSSFFERVQLCYPPDREDRIESQWVSPSVADSVSGADARQFMKRPLIARAIGEDVSQPTMAQATADTKSWLEERREVIRSLRDLEIPSEASTSPIRWIRSVLGW